MVINILLGLIAFLLGLVVTWLFVLCKVIQDKKFNSYFHLDVFDDVSPDMMHDFIEHLTLYYSSRNEYDDFTSGKSEYDEL